MGHSPENSNPLLSRFSWLAFVFIVVIASLAFNLTVNYLPSRAENLNVQIADNADDVSYVMGSPLDPSTGTDLPLGKDMSYPYQDCLRFTNITLAGTDTVTNAYIHFTAARSSSSNNPINCKAYDSDNVDTCEYSQVGSLTTNTAVYTPGSWTAEATYNSNNFNNAVQEIIDRGGWQSGNNIAIWLLGVGAGEQQRVYSYDYYDSSTKSAKLIVEYNDEGGVPEFNTVTLTLTVIVAAIVILVARRYVFAPQRANK